MEHSKFMTQTLQPYGLKTATNPAIKNARTLEASSGPSFQNHKVGSSALALISRSKLSLPILALTRCSKYGIFSEGAFMFSITSAFSHRIM